MIINRGSIAQSTQIQPRTRCTVNKGNSNNSPVFVNQQLLRESFHFDDSHFANQYQALSNQLVSSAKPNATIIRKISIMRKCQRRKDQNQGQKSSKQLCQAFVNFLNRPIESAEGVFPQNNYSEGNSRNYTSCSNRKKASSCSSNFSFRQVLHTIATFKQQVCQKQVKHQIRNSNPYPEHIIKCKRKNTNSRKVKRFNSLDYSIIKPNQIQAVPLRCRQGLIPKNLDNSNCPENLSALREKQDLLKKKMKQDGERRHQIRLKHQQSSGKRVMHMSLNKRKSMSRIQDENQVLPWKVDLNFIDII